MMMVMTEGCSRVLKALWFYEKREERQTKSLETVNKKLRVRADVRRGLGGQEAIRATTPCIITLKARPSETVEGPPVGDSRSRS